MENLIPLHIPSGWAICYNQFIDEDPITTENSEYFKNWDAYKESLLQIKRLDLRNGSHFIPKKTILIDLGWTPEASIHGSFKLIMVNYDLNTEQRWDTIETYTSKDRFDIQSKIEEWLLKMSIRYSTNMTTEEIARMLTYEI